MAGRIPKHQVINLDLTFSLCVRLFYLDPLHGSKLLTRNSSSDDSGIPQDEPFCYSFYMVRAPSLCGLILAAGQSSRMRVPKALLPWRQGTFLSSAIQALSPFSDLVIVVAGSNAEELRPTVDSLGAFLVVNPEPERGQFSSLQVGLQDILNRGRDSAILTPVDRPAPELATVSYLRDQFLLRINEGAWGVIPSFQGKHGHPIFLTRELIGAFLSAPSTSNARDVQHQHQDRLVYAEVNDPLVAANINTPEDYQKLIGVTTSLAH
jgi:molybdenum cofactor cytidylyltransferase